MGEYAAPLWAPWSMRRALASGAQLRQPTWGLGDVWATLLLAQGTTIALYLVLSHQRIDPANGWGLIATTCWAWAVMVGWPLLVASRKGNGAQIDFGLRMKQSHLRFAVLAFAVGMAVASAIGWVITRIQGPFTSAAGELASSQSGLVLLVFAVSTVLVAPACEEIAFRGLLFTALMKRGMSGGGAVVVSAVIFAAFHLEPTRFPLLFALGLALGEVRRRTGSTSAAIVTHMLINVLPAAAMLNGAG